MAGRNFLFVPGPTNVPDRVLRAMAVPMGKSTSKAARANAARAEPARAKPERAMCFIVNSLSCAHRPGHLTMR